MRFRWRILVAASLFVVIQDDRFTSCLPSPDVAAADSSVRVGLLQMALQNLRHTTEYSQLAAFIRAAGAGRKLFYAPNIGNWGDALIHYGTLQFLAHHQIACQTLNRQVLANLCNALSSAGMRLEGVVLLAGGGGAWCSNYPDSRDFLSSFGGFFDHVIVLPTSYELGPLDLDPARVSYFRRDQFGSAGIVPESLFCHDMAFFLDLDIEVPARDPAVKNFFRIDRERHPGSMIPEDNFDISLRGNELSDPVPFFQALAGHQKIRTDRMHVAIAGCLLGTPCDLYPGNYFKSADVYRSSITTNYGLCSLVSW